MRRKETDGPLHGMLAVRPFPAKRGDSRQLISQRYMSFDTVKGDATDLPIPRCEICRAVWILPAPADYEPAGETSGHIHSRKAGKRRKVDGRYLARERERRPICPLHGECAFARCACQIRDIHHAAARSRLPREGIHGHPIIRKIHAIENAMPVTITVTAKAGNLAGCHILIRKTRAIHFSGSHFQRQCAFLIGALRLPRSAHNAGSGNPDRKRRKVDMLSGCFAFEGPACHSI